MIQITEHTAILLFAQSAKREVQSKNFASGKSLSKNILIAEKLFQNAFSVCKKSGLPTFHLDETEQKGSNFADRLKNAFDHVFKLGFKSVIAVGNDCPALCSVDIKKALSKLNEGRSVLGQTHKGGVYLMGIKKSDFLKMDFSAISWHSSKVCNELKEQLDFFGPTFLLKRRVEINALEDTKGFSAFLQNDLQKWLFSQVHLEKANFQEFFSLLTYDFKDQEIVRGPPGSSFS